MYRKGSFDVHNDRHIGVGASSACPGIGLIHELKAGRGQKILGLAEDYSEDERNTLGKTGINNSTSGQSSAVAVAYPN